MSTSASTNPKIDKRERDREQTRQWQRLLLPYLRSTATRLQKMPRAKAMRWGERFGGFAFNFCRLFMKRPLRAAMGNLNLAEFPSPTASRSEREALIRRVFIHFSKTMVDFLRGPNLTKEELPQIVSGEGYEHLDKAIAAGKGVILITAHMGNWEMLGRCVVAHGVPMTVVAREPEDATFAEFIREYRESAGFNVAYKGGSVRELLTILKANKAVGLLPDQNSGDVFLPFFGVPAGTVAGPATLALHTGATLIPCYCVRLPDDTYRMIFAPPIDTHSSGNKDADIQRIMRDANQVLETFIRAYPDQWLWLHHRWKSAFDTHNKERVWGADNAGREAAETRLQAGRSSV